LIEKRLAGSVHTVEAVVVAHLNRFKTPEQKLLIYSLLLYSLSLYSFSFVSLSLDSLDSLSLCTLYAKLPEDRLSTD